MKNFLRFIFTFTIFYNFCFASPIAKKGVIDLSNWEEVIVFGGGFIDGDGVEKCIERVEKLINGESVCIECEEGIWVIGNKSENEVEIDFCKFKLELLKA